MMIFPEIKGNFGFGCMRLPMADGEVDHEQFCRMADAFIAAGFNYFDTAHGYLDGKSETAVREAVVKRHPRERFLLTDKLSANFFHSEDELRPLFESQLAACGVDYFDFYLMHAQNASVYKKYRRCRAYEFALGLRAEGKIRRFGISFHDRAEVLDGILTDWPQIEVVQIQLNYADWESASVQSRQVYEVCRKHGKPAFVMEPVKGGCLVKLPEAAEAALDRLTPRRSNASYALRFAAGLPDVRVVLSGMSDEAQMADNLATMGDFKPLSEDERAALDAARQALQSLNMIPCTACRYCVLENACPKGIRIPELFSCYNLKNTFHSWNQDYYYTYILTRDGGRASECVGCGGCESACPQHLPIRRLLKDVAGEFEKDKK